MALHKTESGPVQIIAYAAQVNSDLASSTLVAGTQIVYCKDSLVRERNPIRRCGTCFQFDKIVRLKCLNQSLQHFLCRDRLEIFLSVSGWDLLEEWDDEVEEATPQGGVGFEDSLETSFILRFNNKRKAQGAHPDCRTFHSSP